MVLVSALARVLAWASARAHKALGSICKARLGPCRARDLRTDCSVLCAIIHRHAGARLLAVALVSLLASAFDRCRGVAGKSKGRIGGADGVRVAVTLASSASWAGVRVDAGSRAIAGKARKALAAGS